MEASSMIMMNPLSSSSSSSSCTIKKSNNVSMMGLSKRNSLKMGGFRDKGQFEYYQSLMRIICGAGGDKKKAKVEETKKKKKKKKKAGKLLKGLSRDLSLFYGMGFGLDSQYYQQNQLNHEGVADQVKFNMMLEASELLYERLKQVRKEEKELKKKMKMEEKKAKAEQKSTMLVSRLESSSESSSSDSELDNEMVVDLNSLKGGLHQPRSVRNLAQRPVTVPIYQEEDGDVSLLPTTSAAAAAAGVWEETYKREGVNSGIGIRVDQETNRIGVELGGIVGKKIEVCTGGKCKKLGAATLIEEFQRVVGWSPNIGVSGCKCMGKCKQGPNVRVVSSPCSETVHVEEMAMAGTTPKNPLCIGVGVEDVGLIMSNFVEDETHQNGVSGVQEAVAL